MDDILFYQGHLVGLKGLWGRVEEGLYLQTSASVSVYEAADLVVDFSEATRGQFEQYGEFYKTQYGIITAKLMGQLRAAGLGRAGTKLVGEAQILGENIMILSGQRLG